uniref:Bardet-Biedl syndrome 2 protein homolog n=1 Tax=Macrostomum lignano TaxID=282301 RepID=A0A1I8F2M2_9PLAT
MPVVPSYQTRLPQKVIPRCVTVGRFDGRSDTLACAARPAESCSSSRRRRWRQIRWLQQPRPPPGAGGRSSRRDAAEHGPGGDGAGRRPVGRAGNLTDAGPTAGRQRRLLSGLRCAQQCRRIFRDAPDGVSAIVVGRLGRQSGVGQLALVGNDVFWSVTGDNVSSLSLCDFLGSGGNELLVGSEDYEIRVFQDDEIVQEITETEVVSCLCAIQGPMFAYGLANGTVGVYERSTRLWRIKSKNTPVAVFAFDLDSDGVPRLITGWSNGKIDARNCRTGEVVFKDHFPALWLALWLLTFARTALSSLLRPRAHSPARTLLETTGVDSASSVHSLMQTRQNLQLELHNYEENAKAQLQQQRQQTRTAAPAAAEKLAGSSGGVQTSLSVDLAHKPAPCVCLRVATTNSTAIRAVIVFARHLRRRESRDSPARSRLGASLDIPLKCASVDLHLKVPGGGRARCAQFHVFETTRSLPRSPSLPRRPGGAPPSPPASSAFACRSGCSGWPCDQRATSCWARRSTATAARLIADSSPWQPGGAAALGGERQKWFLFARATTQVIGTDNMELAGELVTALAGLPRPGGPGLGGRVSRAADSLKSLRWTESASSRRSASAYSGDMADSSNLVRGLVVRARGRQAIGRFCETLRRPTKRSRDSNFSPNYCRLHLESSLGRWPTRARARPLGYGPSPSSTLQKINFSEDSDTKMAVCRPNFLQPLRAHFRCIGGSISAAWGPPFSGLHIGQRASFLALSESLKALNQIIQRAGRLRAGRFKTQAVNDCRAAR